MIQRALTVEEICNKLRPVFGKRIDEIYFQYTVAEGREEREEIVHILNALYQKHLNRLLDKGVLLEPPRKELIDGTYNLATVSYANRKLFDFKLREKDWPRHICVSGMSGSGKTTFAFKILESLNAHNKPYLIFDWKKSFRPLSATDSGIMTFTVGDDKVSNLFKTNINQPPKGVAPKEWINVLSDLLTESFSASFGVHKVILETLDEAFKEWGIYEGSENYPTWNHIKWRLEEKIEKIRGRESGWIESALRIATVMTFGEFGKVVNYKGNNGFTVEELLDKRVVMELNSLGNIEKTFFCEFVLMYIYKLKKAGANQSNGNFDSAIIVDEAHNIFLKKPTNFSNESITDMVYREMREYGTSLICLDQHISKISDTVKGNSACHIAFQQQLPQDIYEISEIMSLRENKQYFSQLPVGSAIVKMAERYTSPFLVNVPYVKMREKTITDGYIKERMKALILGQSYKNKVDPEFNKAIENPKAVGNHEAAGKLKVIESPIEKPRKNPVGLSEAQKMIYDFVIENLEKNIKLEEIEKVLVSSKKQGRYTDADVIKVINLVFESQLSSGKPETPQNNLPKNEEIFMTFLQENPEHSLSTTEIYKEIGFSARKGTATKKILEKKNLIRVEEIKYNKGWKKIIRPNHQITFTKTKTKIPAQIIAN